MLGRTSGKKGKKEEISRGVGEMPEEMERKPDMQEER